LNQNNDYININYNLNDEAILQKFPLDPIFKIPKLASTKNASISNLNMSTA